MTRTARATRVAVIGAGPIGLEAALHAKSFGYDVVVMEARQAGANITSWGFVTMFTPWSMNTTAAGRRAAGDDPMLASADRAPTGEEFVEKYLLPLSQSDALAGCVDAGVRVLAVGRDRPHEPPGDGGARRGRAPFRLLVADRFGVEQVDRADVVLDCAGTYGNFRWAGPGGVPAPGEAGMKQSIWYVVPDVLGRDRVQFADRHTLLVGTGTSAATILMDLARLAANAPGTRVTWAFRRWGQILRLVDEDPLPARRALTEQVLRLSASPPPWLELVEDAGVESVSGGRGKSVVLRVAGGGLLTRRVDEIVAAVGHRPDESLFAPLGGRPAYACADRTRDAVECAAPDAGGGPRRVGLVTVVPGYYVLGAKSYGINSSFLLRVGHRQVEAAIHDILRHSPPGAGGGPAPAAGAAAAASV